MSDNETKQPVTQDEVQAAVLKATEEIIKENRKAVIQRAREILRQTRPTEEAKVE